MWWLHALYGGERNCGPLPKICTLEICTLTYHQKVTSTSYFDQNTKYNKSNVASYSMYVHLAAGEFAPLHRPCHVLKHLSCQSM